jgi:trigger factor
MSVVLSVQEVGPCRKQLKVEIPAEAVAGETERVVREWGKKTRLPGFRKGHVPPAVVRRRFKQEIEGEVVDRLLPIYWQKARDEGGLEPLAPPEVDEVGTLAEGEPLTFVATVEVRPPIALGDLDGFDLPDPAIEPTDREIDDALDELRRRVADWREVERPAARGDRATAEIVEVPAGEATEPAEPAAAEPTEPAAANPVAEPQTVSVEIGDPGVWEELSLAVTDLAAGQSGRFVRRPAEGDEAPPRSFRVRVTKVEERELPPLDDAFAARVAKVETLAELRAQVVAGLTRGKRDERRRARETALRSQLRARHPVNLPQGVVRHEVEHLLRDYAEQLGRQGIDPQKVEIDWQNLGEQVRPEAERRVHDRLLLDAVADHESIVVGDDELEAAVATLARAQGINPGLLRSRLVEGGRLDGLRSDLRRAGAVRHLLGEQPAADAADAGDAAEHLGTATTGAAAGGEDPDR